MYSFEIYRFPTNPVKIKVLALILDQIYIFLYYPDRNAMLI